MTVKFKVNRYHKVWIIDVCVPETNIGKLLLKTNKKLPQQHQFPSILHCVTIQLDEVVPRGHSACTRAMAPGAGCGSVHMHPGELCSCSKHLHTQRMLNCKCSEGKTHLQTPSFFRSAIGD